MPSETTMLHALTVKVIDGLGIQNDPESRRTADGGVPQNPYGDNAAAHDGSA